MSAYDYMKDRNEAERTGLCMECGNPRLKRYLVCEKCAEGVSYADLEFDCVIPSLVKTEAT